MATPSDESALAAALVATEGSGVAAPVTALARPYPPNLAATGLAAPTVPEFRVDTRLWLAAIDWNALVTAGQVPAPPAEEPRIQTPAWAADQAAEYGQRFAEGVAALDVVEVGGGVCPQRLTIGKQEIECAVGRYARGEFLER